jgi:hypothetical protein
MRHYSFSPAFSGERATPVGLACLQTNSSGLLRCVARQKMQRELALQASHEILDHCLLVCRQSIDDQSHWLFAPVHHLVQQLDKLLSGQPAFVGGEPESAFDTDGRRGAAATLSCLLKRSKIP